MNKNTPLLKRKLREYVEEREQMKVTPEMLELGLMATPQREVEEICDRLFRETIDARLNQHAA